MTIQVHIDPDALMEARRHSPRRPRTTDKWAKRLAAEPWIQNHAVGDLGHDVTALPGGNWDGQWVTKLTGVEPSELLHHPGGSDYAAGGKFYSREAVALALIFLARLGAEVDARRLTAPLRRRLTHKREFPLLTHEAVDVLWAPKQDAGIHVAVFHGQAPTEPYALRLADGRYVIGFGNPLGDRVEAVGHNRGLHAAALAAGLRLLRPEFRELLASARPVEQANVVTLPTVSTHNPTPPEAA